MVLLVIVTPKYVGFGYYLGEMPHTFKNQKPQKLEENQKKQKKQKNQSPGGNLWEQHFSQDFGFFGFFGFFPRPVADESFRV